ncbi:hypothetical protein FA95DRAFT_588073 [Auriscalpium vulgare]|uniref:Uncharacterized protein n=1 Tax=Auriscalpium vulgare TaxID=40419 RepID=A0ACB8REG4_9AGAM|nr:hypothetical protein FA95DRAFT_588073 [Auriscalpium vulgare]
MTVARLYNSYPQCALITVDRTFQTAGPVVRRALSSGGYKWQPQFPEFLPAVPEFTPEQLREYAADCLHTASSFEFTRSDATFFPMHLCHSSGRLLPAAWCSCQHPFFQIVNSSHAYNVALGVTNNVFGRSTPPEFARKARALDRASPPENAEMALSTMRRQMRAKKARSWRSRQSRVGWP